VLVPQGGECPKGPGSRAAGLAVAFKLIQSAQERRRAANAPRLVALVRASARFEAAGSPDEVTSPNTS